jgi:uncharacterized membrane protein YdbT with pleckstrin-like domain
MESEPAKMKPIWYFVGLMLTLMGLVIEISGLYRYFSAEHTKTVLENLHPEIWWGAIIIIAGVILLLANRRARVG